MKTYAQKLLVAPPERLALFRFLVGIFSLIYLVARAPGFYQTAHSGASWRPVGICELLPILREAALDPLLASSLYGATILGAVCFTWGVGYRWTAPLFALLLFWVTSYKSSFGMVFHSENLLLLQVIAVAFSPAQEVASFDARWGWARPSSERGRGWRYGLPLVAAAAFAIGSYFVAGVAKLKLSGFDWITGETLRIQIAYDNLRKIELGSFYSPLGVVAVRYPWLFPPMGFLTVLAEVLGVFALLHCRIAQAWVLLVVLFHWGVLALMAIVFAYPLTGIPFACLFFCEQTRWGKWFLARLPQPR
ncbi:MAG: HTTM domain-containing protein [Polyangiaceae bacterium]|nr:HTTM domain-containing protein [Polyangiaceae bacterium]